MNVFVIVAILVWSAFGFHGNAATDLEMESRIERVIKGLLPDLPIENRFGEKVSLSSRMAHFNTPGVSIAVINNGRIEWARGFGVKEHGKKSPVTERTLFQAASISKAVFAVGVMRLVQNGKLDLDVDVNSYLKGWQIPKVENWQPRLTLRQLLSHTAGLRQHTGFPGYRRGQALPSLVDILEANAPSNSPAVAVTILPGTQMRYTGAGTTIAEKVVVDTLNEPLPTIMQNLIFARVGMTETTFQQPLPKNLEKLAATAHYQNNIPVQGKWHIYPEHAAAGLWTTPSDLAKLGIELQRALKKESEHLLTQGSVTRMLTPEVSDFMGLGFFLRGSGDNTRFEHPGGNQGFRAKAIFYKHHGLGAVIMINSNEGDLIAEIERAIAREYGWPGYFVEEKPPLSLTKRQVESLAAVYVSASNDVAYEIVNEEARIFLKLNGQSPIELVAESTTKFRAGLLNTSLSFDSNALTITQEGNVITAHKKKEKKR